jgi:uncharacterized protein
MTYSRRCRLFSRLLVPPKSSFFLLGPRGTGKTTWLRQHFAKACWLDLLDEATYLNCLQDANYFPRLLETVPAGGWVVIDEIQRLPSLLNEVHRQIGSRHLKFALTGSSARKLRRQGVNLLAGRALQKFMHPLLPAELGDVFELDPVLTHGALPLVIDSSTSAETMSAYAQLYLKEEVQAEALTRNLAGFARFLPIISLFHGQNLNISSLARDAGVQRPTAQGFVEILVDTLLLHKVPAFDARLRVREKKHPKLYFIDPGLARALKRARGPLIPEERGPLFEGYVFTMLRAYADYFNAFDEIAYWAPADAKITEVDFIVSRGRELWAIEAKATDRIREDHFTGLRAVDGLKGLRRRIVVYTGKTSQRTSDGIDILPVLEFEKLLQFGLNTS